MKQKLPNNALYWFMDFAVKAFFFILVGILFALIFWGFITG